MSPRTAFTRWALAGLVTSCFLVWAQAGAVGGVAGMLEVGETSALRSSIENELGPIPLAPGPGHDGQIYYATALDLDGDEVGPLLDHAAYRYRRILLPFTASLGGILGGQPLLYGQLLVGILSMSIASGMLAAMAVRAGRTPLLALTVLLNPGVWLSVQLLTSDILALALMILALDLALRRSPWQSGVVFGLSVLAKDVFLATPVPLAVPNLRRRWPMAVVPVGALVTWMSILTVTMGDGFAARGNLDWPFLGLVDASANWVAFDAKEWLYLVAALGFVAVGIVFSLRRSWLRWPIAAWTGLALISSSWVWDFGNNAVRAFSPIVVLVALAGCHVTTGADSPRGDLAAAGS